MSATATATRRALGVIRLSVGGLNQTGEDTQRRRITNRCIADEVNLLDEWAVDIDVSASYSPWARPELGKWLNDRINEFDVLYVYKLDRIVRSVRDLSNLLDWCEKHGKTLVSVEEGFDLGTSWGRTIAKILAVLAEAELEVMKERARASRDTSKAKGRWPGGLVPFGRISVPVENGDGYTLELCPKYGPWLLRMIEKFLEVKNFAAVARWLNDNKVPTAQDIARIRAAKASSTNTRLSGKKAKPRGKQWAATSVQNILTSRSLIGEYVRADGSVERNADGTPILRSVPVLSPEKFEELQAVIRTVKYTKGTGSTSPLLGVLYCICGKPLYYTKENGNKVARFKCVGNNSQNIPACPGQSFPASEILQELRSVFLAELHSLPILEKRVSTDDTALVKMAVLESQLQQYMDELKAGRLDATEFARLTAETAQERQKVAETPSGGSRVEWVDTGKTYGKWWDAVDTPERREKLVTWGVKAVRGGDGMTLDTSALKEGMLYSVQRAKNVKLSNDYRTELVGTAPRD
ncbi:recombinase family protein [Streptomyces sp. ISL-10]|uniref:recombinase family protein n=1 Tax=Streptomyces sp. ISL-10 TaxID=2819172 RepID=UPI001BE76303|nr:recombinase family protein [Streptomyces sp. ISL-10]MBT2365226.1 recombinase family protein [Streptomyces sp. ISL-10]